MLRNVDRLRKVRDHSWEKETGSCYFELFVSTEGKRISNRA